MENVVLRVDGIRFPGTSEEETVEFVTEGKMYEKGGSLFSCIRRERTVGI